MNRLYRLSTITIIAATLLFSCNSGPKPENIAQEFINAYLATDYEKAADYCTPALGQDLLQALEEADALNQNIKEKIKLHTQNYSSQIDSVKLNKAKDTTIVYYSILNGCTTDSLNIAATQIIERTLTMVKQEEGWKVNSLNKQ